jgi:hypothetical protein
MRNIKTIIAALCLALFGAAPAFAWKHSTQTPPQASAAGFNTQTFNSVFASAKFDMAGTNATGKEWYLYNFFGGTASSSGLTLNADKSLTIAGVSQGQISTAADLGGGNFVGTAFGGGGYFEATLKFNPAIVNTANGWPAFWSMAIEHLAQTAAQQWSGQAAGYNHFIEADFFEYNISNGISYSGTLHDWYGIFNSTCPPNYCNVASPNVRPGITGFNWNTYHKVGMLWIPATGGTNGSATFYLDDVQQGSPVTWSQFTTQSPPPGGSATWTFGVYDNQHVAVILGTGLNQFLTVQSVRVWQASSAGNLVH